MKYEKTPFVYLNISLRYGVQYSSIRFV